MTTALITREYNGNVFHFREDGYFNMTKAAKAFGKDLQVFIRRDDTVEYIDALSKTVPDTELVQAKGRSLRRHLGTPQARRLLRPLAGRQVRVVLRHGHRRHPQQEGRADYHQASHYSEKRLLTALTRASIGITLKHIETVKDVARLRDELRVHLGIHFNEEFIAEITKEIQ